MKKYLKYWLYPVCFIIPALALSLPLIFGAKLPVAYGVCWGLLCGAGCMFIARFIVHAVEKDNNVKYLASQIWSFITLAIFTLFILNESSAVQTVLVFSLMTTLLNAICFRYIDFYTLCNDEKSVTYESKKDKIKRLAEEMKYQLTADGVPNYDAPLCLVDGVALTPKEAEAKGYGSLYASALEYIKSIV